MRLADLNPKLAGGFLTFDCPTPGHTDKIRVPVSRDHGSYGPGAAVWFLTGEFPDTLTLTLSPSVDAKGCWHGHVASGAVR